MSDIVYHEHNPDPYVDCCRQTGLNEPGVVFMNVMPETGVYTFIGKTALVEAIATVFGKGPKETMSILTENNSRQLRARVGKLEDEKALLAERLAMYQKLALDEVKNERSGHDTDAEQAADAGSA